MVSIRFPPSKSSNPFNNSLVTVPNVAITIGLIVICMFHNFLKISSKVEVLILLFTFFQFYFVVSWNSEVENFAISILFFFLFWIIIWSGFLAEIQWSVCKWKSYRSLCVLFSRSGTGLWLYHLFVWSNFNFLHVSLRITPSTESFLVLYSFCANLPHSLIMWLIVSSLSPRSLHLLICCVLSILALIWLVLKALFCASIRRDFVSLLKFPFLSPVQVLYYYYYLTYGEFFTSAFADSFQ